MAMEQAEAAEGDGEDAFVFNLTQIGDSGGEGESLRHEGAERHIKERGDEGALAADILEDLNTDSIRSLRRSFAVIGGDDGVQEGEFVKMMMAYLNPEDGPTRLTHEDIKDRVGKLRELFAEIDVNGDGTMQWEEFTEFLIEAGMVSREEMSVDAIKKYYASPLQDNTRHDDLIEQIKYFPALDRLCVLEHRALGPKVYKVDNCMLIKNLSGQHEQSVLAMEHCVRELSRQKKDDGDFSLIATAAGDCRLEFWDATTYSNQFHIPTEAVLRFYCSISPPSTSQIRPCSLLPLPDPISAAVTSVWLRWYCDRLFSGSRDFRFGPSRDQHGGLIHHWDVTAQRDKGILGDKKIHELLDMSADKVKKYIHTDHVMDLCGIDGMDMLVSAGMDKRIGMWDIKTNQLKAWLEKKGTSSDEYGHSQGVTSLAYNADYRMIFSAGFDTHCFVWNPIVERCIFRMEGHTSPLVGVKVVPDSPQIITGDHDGYLRLWDIRNFRCVQKWRPASQEMTCFEVIPMHRKVVVGGKKMNFFESEKTVDSTVTDSQLVTCAMYNDVSMSFMTVSDKTIKIWSAVTGRVSKIYHDVSNSEITTCCFDTRRRKVIFGNSDGEIKVLNYNNGVVMKEIQGHSRDVSGVCYCCCDPENSNNQNVIASCSWDRKTKSYDEEDPEFLKPQRAMEGHDADVTCIAYSDTADLLITGSVDLKGNNVRLWDLNTGQREPMMVLQHLPGHLSEIVSVVFCGQLPLCCAADAAGLISFLYTRPSRGCMQFFFFDTVTEISYDEATSPPLRGRQFALSCISYDEQSECIVTGDEEGRIRLWNITDMLNQLDAMTVFPSKLLQRVRKAKGKFLPLEDRCKRDVASATQSGMAQVTKDCVRLQARWTAHKDVIKTIQVVREPNVIVSCGMDRRVHVWSLTGEKYGTLLQGNGRNKSWNFDLLYEQVALKREHEENIKVEHCIEEASKIDLDVDTSIPPPTPPPRGPDGAARRPTTSGGVSSTASPKPQFTRSKTSLGGATQIEGSLEDLIADNSTSRRKARRSPSRISLARQQQEAAIDPLRVTSFYPTHKGKTTPLNKRQHDAAEDLQRAVKDAMLGLWQEDA